MNIPQLPYRMTMLGTSSTRTAMKVPARLSSQHHHHHPQSLRALSTTRGSRTRLPNNTVRNQTAAQNIRFFPSSSYLPRARPAHTSGTRTMASNAAAKKEFLCLVPDKPGTVAKRMEVRPYVFPAFPVWSIVPRCGGRKGRPTSVDG